MGILQFLTTFTQLIRNTSTMKLLYLVMAVIGYAATLLLMLLESFENKNILLWTKPDETISALFINRISTTFTIDLLWAVLVFFIWVVFEGRRLGMRRVWKYHLLTLLFGLAGTFPLFLYHRQKQLEKQSN
ncbi:MAG: hypothetical protein CMN32_10880 [Saprospirales bacterium]|nr:hypothetical protein [Saprospirales bacterium]